MPICNSVQPIQPTECIGDSLVKINTNFSNLNADACSLVTMIRSLSGYLANQITVTEYEAVIGSAETTYGILNRNVLSQPINGSRPGQKSRLVDFNYKKANNTETMVRMEDVNLATYLPWANFFTYSGIGYKPILPNKTLSKTKLFVQQAGVQLNSWVNRDQIYTLLVDWETGDVLLTGSITSEWGHGVRFFIKKWNFNNIFDYEIEIKNDSNAASVLVDGEGESNTNYLSEVYGFSTVMKCRITPTYGIEGIPLFTIYNPLGPYFAYNSTKETAGISIFIENTYKPTFPAL